MLYGYIPNMGVPVITRHHPWFHEERQWLAKTVLKRLTVGAVVGIASTLLFLQIWDWVRDKKVSVTAFDRQLPLWMSAHQTPWATEAARFLAWLGAPAVMIGIATVTAITGLFWNRVRSAAWTLPIAIAGAGLLIQLLKVIVARARPDLFAPLVAESGYSFPSGHSLIAVVVYGLLAYFAVHLVRNTAFRIGISVCAAVLVLLIGLSRIYVGVHYPTDVLAGWTAGVPWLIACIWLHDLIERRDAKAGEPMRRSGPLKSPPPH